MNPLTSPHLSQKLIAIALLWCGLAALVYVPSATAGFESSMIAAAGFIAQELVNEQPIFPLQF